MVQSEMLPIEELKSIGCRWVVVVFGQDRTTTEMEAVIRHYSPWPVVLICYSLAQAEIAYSRKWPVLIAPFNEPDMPDQANLTPQQVLNAYAKLHALGIPVVGPNVCIPGSAWDKEFRASRPSWLQFYTTHGYGVPIGELVKGMDAHTICTEFGGTSEPKTTEDRVANALAVQRAGITAALWQAPLGYFDSTPSGWKLNDAGRAVASALAAAAT